MKPILIPAVAAAAASIVPVCANAHGFAGKRFFPATLATDDPFVADELSLPTVSTVPDSTSGGAEPTQETDVGVDIAKRITPNFGIELGETWLHVDPKESRSSSGFDNLDLGAKYLLVVSDPSEFLLSAGLNASVGGTGSKLIGADAFSTVTPVIFAGKGFGDLPDSVALLKPFALTGVVGLDIPMESQTTTEDGDIERHPHALNVGFALEYSLIYLQSNVRDIGLGSPFNRMIPLVEVNLQTPLDRRSAGITTGTINPGVIWSGRYMQIGLEAVVPINGRSGDGPGIIGQLHIYLDDLFPDSIGKPIFEAGR